MFGSADDPDEERLECMVKLLQTCGKKLDETGSPETAKVRKALDCGGNEAEQGDRGEGDNWR